MVTLTIAAGVVEVAADECLSASVHDELAGEADRSC